jgi:hypothetical protein
MSEQSTAEYARYSAARATLAEPSAIRLIEPPDEVLSTATHVYAVSSSGEIIGTLRWIIKPALLKPSASEFIGSYPHGALRGVAQKPARPEQDAWPLAELDARIVSIGAQHGVDRACVAATRDMLRHLHDVALSRGLVLPAPAIGLNPDVGVEIEWFYRAQGRVLTFAIADDGRPWMFWASGDNSDEAFAPTPDAMVSRLRWVADL